jgi:hypothetical protein
MAELENQSTVTVRFPVVPAGPSNRNGTGSLKLCSFPELQIAQVDDLLQPSKWPDLCGAWTAMPTVDGREGVELASGQEECFHEHFAVAGFTLDPILRFKRIDAENPPARSLEYRLAGPPGPDDFVLIDEGCIFLRELDGDLHITTTKRVRFAPPFDGVGLALLAGAGGYLDAFEDMVSKAVELARTEHAGRST